MIQKVLRVVPAQWLLFFAGFLLRVKEVRSRKDKESFHRLWAEVWLEVGYAYGGEPLPEVEEYYAQFDPFSTDLLLLFLWFPIGTMRLIWENEEVGLPVFRDFEVVKDWDKPVVELELLTLKPEWRGLAHLPSFILWREGYRRAKEAGCDIVAALDRRFFHLLKRLFPVHQIGKERFFQGSITHPVFLDLAEARRVLAKKNPLLLRFFDPMAAQRLIQEAG